ncbi:MAG TPA: TadE/TadG family type IV pilus assembly protein [Dehalococcoidia bacterium]|nr:TadE/TadG family type IV pilus assembly protein [Dehalococcoidia bacterium]
MVEFSVVLLAFLMLVFGVIEFARLYESWVVVQHAAREGARYGVTGRADCAASSPSRETCIAYTAQNSLANLSTADSSVSTKSWDYPNYTTSVSGAGNACDVLEVDVTYNHKIAAPIISNIIGTTVTLHAKERMINEPFATCQ